MGTRLIILGAAGDLTSRYLIPAIASLHQNGEILISGPILGVSLDEWDTEQFRAHIAEHLKKHASDLPEEVRTRTVASLEYRRADITDREELKLCLGDPSEPIALYLALPPKIAGKVIRTLQDISLPAGSRIVAEKPFGHDLASAQELNELLHNIFQEKSVYRIDHFLGKQTVQNVLGLRFANRVFESLWSRDHIEHVEITWDETIALEGRANYYDSSGALKDMVQNHLLQLLCLVAMEAPLSFNERDFRDKKVDVLRAVRQFSPEEVVRHTVRGRYTKGKIDDRTIPNYTDESGVDPARKTETYASCTLFIDNWRWAGVPFVLRTGKAIGQNRHDIVIHFRPVPHLAFEESAPQSNLLRLRLNPDRMELGVNINGPGNPFDLERIGLNAELAPQELSAYARLLMDLFEGNAVLSIRGDEAEESWRIVEPILAVWKNDTVPLRDYPAGSDGPA